MLKERESSKKRSKEWAKGIGVAGLLAQFTPWKLVRGVGVVAIAGSAVYLITEKLTPNRAEN